MNKPLVGILGGTGFVSGHRAAHLCNRGVRTRIITAHPERHRDIKVLPGLELTKGDIFDPTALARNLEGCAAAINLVGILNPPGRTLELRARRGGLSLAYPLWDKEHV
jgi:uncharacterized protein YbjT (DUF2867 family)